MATKVFINRVERLALVLGLLATAASAITLDPALVGGVFIGAATGWLNLAVVRLLFERGARMPERRLAVMSAFLVKSLLLLTMVSLIVFVMGVDGVGFIVGFSSGVASIIVMSAVQFLAGPEASAPAGDGNGT